MRCCFTNLKGRSMALMRDSSPGSGQGGSGTPASGDVDDFGSGTHAYGDGDDFGERHDTDFGTRHGARARHSWADRPKEIARHRNKDVHLRFSEAEDVVVARASKVEGLPKALFVRTKAISAAREIIDDTDYERRIAALEERVEDLNMAIEDIESSLERKPRPPRVRRG